MAELNPPLHHNCKCTISVSFDEGQTWKSLGETVVSAPDASNPLWDELRQIVIADEETQRD